MKQIILILLLGITTTTVCAQWNKKVKGDGNLVTVERSTGDYDAITIGGFFEVALVDGAEGKLTLKGENNILEYIKTEVKGGTLIVKPKDNMQLRPSNGMKVFVTVPVEKIDALRLSGSGAVTAKKALEAHDFKIHASGSKHTSLNIDAKTITIISSGSSAITLSGTADQLDISSSGSSKLRGFDLITETAEVTSSGSSSIQITVNDKIKAQSSGSSTIKSRGNPNKVHSRSSGSSSMS